MKFPKQILLSIAGIIFCILALTTAWFGVEKARLSYEVERYKGILKDKSEFITKLETERDLLLSPNRLVTYAKRYGLFPAKTGQLRTLPLPQENVPNTRTIPLE